MKKILFSVSILFAFLLGQSQVTQVASTQTQTTSPVVPVVINIPKNGGQVKFTLTPNNIPQLQVPIPALNITMHGFKIVLTCQNVDVTHVTCTGVQ